MFSRLCSELLLKTLCKITWTIESHHVTHFVYTILVLLQKHSCTAESYHLYHFIRRNVSQSLYLCKQSASAYSEFRSKKSHVEFCIRYIVLNNSIHTRKKFIVNSCICYSRNWLTEFGDNVSPNEARKVSPS